MIRYGYIVILTIHRVNELENMQMHRTF